MKKMRAMVLTFVLVIVAGCSGREAAPAPERGAASAAAVLVLDNHGGFAGPGCRIVVLDDGTFTRTTYTDVVGDEQTTRGRWRRSDDGAELTLEEAGGREVVLRRSGSGADLMWTEPGARASVVKLRQDYPSVSPQR